jgi:phosphoribosylaminoimidazolecarboxamide formyltransferase/IMP cyclohydrolase
MEGETMAETVPGKVGHALISVSDKRGLDSFARRLHQLGIVLYSTGGTRSFLESNGIPVLDIAAYTGFPEVMDGRLKTLHPKIFGGILARRDRTGDQAVMEEHQIVPFDLVVVNLYPFQETVAREGVTVGEAIEQIDIGGPSLLRAAAKNHAWVSVVTDPSDYDRVAGELEQRGVVAFETRRRLAGRCYAHTAAYDAAIAEYFRGLERSQEDAVGTAEGQWPEKMELSLHRVAELRYGENPHQPAAVYRLGSIPGALVDAKQLHGKELSYNNLLDLESALSISHGFAQPAAVVIKHNNPCGAAVGHKLYWACRKAFAGDPVSAFGGIVGLNRMVDAQTAQFLCEPGLFVEAVVAPEFSREAMEILTTKPKWRDSVRLMATGNWTQDRQEIEYRFLRGGVLVQHADRGNSDPSQWRAVTEVPMADELMEDITFAWEMVRHVKSNAIVLATDASLVGVGAGQMSRVDSVEIAIQKAGERSRGSVLASDAFFPFPDSIDKAAAAGVVAIIQPGGSRKDEEVIAACNRHRIPMLFTGHRHFKH